MKSISKKILISLIISSIFISHGYALNLQLKDTNEKETIIKIKTNIYDNNDPFEYVNNLYKLKNDIRQTKKLIPPLIKKGNHYLELIRKSNTEEEKEKLKKELNKIDFEIYSLQKELSNKISLYQNEYVAKFKNFINKYYKDHPEEWDNFINGLKSQNLIKTKDKITTKEYRDAFGEIFKKRILLQTMLGTKLSYGNKDYNYGDFNDKITKEKINKYLSELGKNSINFKNNFRKINEKDPNGKSYYVNLKVINQKRREKYKRNNYSYNKTNSKDNNNYDINNRNNKSNNIKKENTKKTIIDKESLKEKLKERNINKIIGNLKYIDTYQYNSKEWRTDLDFSDKDINNIYLYLMNITNDVKIESEKKEVYDKLFKEKIYLKDNLDPKEIQRLFIKLNGYNSVNIEDIAKMYYTQNKISSNTKKKLKKLLDELLLINKTLKEKLTTKYKNQLVPTYFSEKEYKNLSYSKLRDELTKLNYKVRDNADKFRFETNSEEKKKILKEKKYLDSQINIISPLSFLYIRDGAINRKVKEIKEYNSIYNKYMSLLNKKALHSIKRMDDEKVIKILLTTTKRRSEFNYANLVKGKVIYDVLNDFLLNNTTIGQKIKNKL